MSNSEFDDSTVNESEYVYIDLIAKLKDKNRSQYEALAERLSSGGEEILIFKGEKFRFFVDQSKCTYSTISESGKETQQLSWTQLSEKSSERRVEIVDALAECEARALLGI